MKMVVMLVYPHPKAPPQLFAYWMQQELQRDKLQDKTMYHEGSVICSKSE